MSKFKVGDMARSKYGTEVEVLHVGLKRLCAPGVLRPGFLGRIIKASSITIGQDIVWLEDDFEQIPKIVTISTDFWTLDALAVTYPERVITFMWECSKNDIADLMRFRNRLESDGRHPTSLVKITKTITVKE